MLRSVVILLGVALAAQALAESDQQKSRQQSNLRPNKKIQQSEQFLQQDHICGQNEYFDRCGRVCEKTCETFDNPACQLSCNPAQCTCKQGYVRKNLQCVPAISCSNPNDQVFLQNKVGQESSSSEDDDQDPDDQPTGLAPKTQCGNGLVTQLCIKGCKKGCKYLTESLQPACMKKCVKTVCRCDLNAAAFQAFVENEDNLPETTGHRSSVLQNVNEDSEVLAERPDEPTPTEIDQQWQTNEDWENDDDDQPAGSEPNKQCGNSLVTQLCIKGCKKGCNYLPESLKAACIKKCAKTVCRCDLSAIAFQTYVENENIPTIERRVDQLNEITEDQCLENEYLNQCGNHCEPKCNDTSLVKICDLMCRPPACHCKQGFYRNQFGQCVHRTWCRLGGNHRSVLASKKPCGDPRFTAPCIIACETGCYFVPKASQDGCIKQCARKVCQCDLDVVAHRAFVENENLQTNNHKSSVSQNEDIAILAQRPDKQTNENPGREQEQILNNVEQEETNENSQGKNLNTPKLVNKMRSNRHRTEQAA